MICSGVLLVPLYLKYIPLPLYGAWLATGNILVWITVVDPGLSLVLQQKIANLYGAQDKYKIGSFITSGLLLTMGVCSVLLLIGAAMFFLFPLLLKLPSSIDINVLKNCFLITLIGSAFLIFSYSLTAINQGLQSSKGIGLIYVLVALTGIIISMIMLKNNYGLYSMAIVPLISGVGLTAGNLGYLFWRCKTDEIPFVKSLQEFKGISKLVSYSFMGRLGGVIASNMDLFVVAKFLGPQNAAFLNLTRKAPDMSKMFIERPVIAFIPSLAHLNGCGEREKQVTIIVRLVRILFWIIGLVLAGFWAFNDDFVKLWVGEKMFAGQTISIIISLTVLLTAITDSFGNLCIALGSIKKNSLVSFGQAILSAVLIIIGAKYFGMLGVVVSPLIALLLFSSWLYPKHLISILQLDFKLVKNLFYELIKVLILTIILALVFSQFIVLTWFSFLLLTGAQIALYFITLMFLSSVFRHEAKKMILNWRR
jgi:O-antigen/teichoic acid export membrane protein